MSRADYVRVKLGKDSSGRRIVLNQRTNQMRLAAEKRLGKPLSIVQGSYMAGHGATASAGTHDGGGVLDFRTWDLPDKDLTVHKVLLALREVGFAAWHRTKAEGFDDHIHAVAIGDAELATLAAQQVISYRHGRNGLANNGLDDGPHVDPIETWEQYEAAHVPVGRPLTLYLHMPHGPLHTHWTKVAQRRLNIPVTGKFDHAMRRAVISYRHKHNLGRPFGWVGARVWRQMGVLK